VSNIALRTSHSRRFFLRSTASLGVAQALVGGWSRLAAAEPVRAPNIVTLERLRPQIPYGVMMVALRNLAGKTLFSVELEPQLS
jgi:hypothetical protein